MESSHKARKIIERLLLCLLLGMMAFAAWEQASSPLVQKLSTHADDTITILLSTSPAMQISYNPFTQKAHITVQTATCNRKKHSCPPENSFPFFMPKETDQDEFWQTFKQGLASWRYNPLWIGRTAWAYLTAWHERRTTLSVAEFILLALELSQLEANDFTVTFPSNSKKQVPIPATSLDRAPLAVQNRPLVIEVLNASGKKGLALELTQYLREQNDKGLLRVDVLQYDNYPSIQSSSWLEDYSGRQIQLKQLGNAIGINGEIRTGNVPNIICDTRIILGKDFKMPL